MAHAPLDVVHEPPLAVDRYDGNFCACDIAVVLEDAAAGHEVFADLPALDALLTDLNRADGCKGFLERFVVLKVCLAVAFFLAVDGLEDADRLVALLDLVDLGDVDRVGRCPVEFVRGHLVRPGCRVVVPLLLVGLEGHGGEDVAGAGVALVLALGVQVEEHGAVGVVDRLDADALPVVLVVVFVLVDSPQAPGSDAATHCFLEGVVVGFVG